MSEYTEGLALMERNKRGGAPEFCHFEETVKPETIRKALKIAEALSGDPSNTVYTALITEAAKNKRLSLNCRGNDLVIVFKAMSQQLIKDASE